MAKILIPLETFSLFGKAEFIKPGFPDSIILV